MQADPSPIAQQELFRHVEWVRALARNLVDDPHLAEDVEQETWRRALEHPPRHGSNLKGWLAAVARNTARQWKRSEVARRGREHGVARSAASQPADELLAEAQLQRELVDRVIALDEIHRTALLLRYFRNLSVAQVAQELDVPLNTARSRIARGLEKLRQGMDGCHGRERWTRALLPVAAAGSTGSRAAGIAVAAGLLLAVGIPSYLLTRPGDPRAAIASAHLVPALPPELAVPALGAQRTQAPPESAAVAEGPTSSASGTLEIQVVDPAGKPVSDLAYVVYSERGGDRVHARGRTDANGRGHAGGLEENTYILRTEGRAPFAPGVRATWLQAGKSESIQVPLLRGGSFVGRVVDDRGLPIEGLETLAAGGLDDDSPGYETTMVGTTDAQGRFRIDHQRSMPRGVWIVDGEERPERWSPVSFCLQDPEFPGWRMTNVNLSLEDDEEKDTGTHVFPRTIHYRGRLLSADGRPLADSIVSSNPKRRSRLTSNLRMGTEELGIPPWHPAFRLLPGEARSDENGAFAFEMPWSEREHAFGVVVWTAGGITQRFELPRVDPGRTHAGLVLTLRDADLLVIRLLDGEGNPIGDLADLPDEHSQGTGRFQFLRLMHDLQAHAVYADGDFQDFKKLLDGDGALRLELAQPPGELRHVELFVPHHLPQPHALPQGWEPERELTIRVRPAPRMRIEASFDGPPDDGNPLRLRLHACLMDLPTLGQRDRGWADCCGLGALGWVDVSDEPARLDLVVQSEEPLWLHVSGTGRSARAKPQSYGPFVAGPARIDITIPIEALEPKPQEPREPPPSTRPGEIEPQRMEALRAIGYAGGGSETPAAEPETVRVRFLLPDGSPLPGGIVWTAAGQEFRLDDDGRAPVPKSVLPGDLDLLFPVGTNRYGQQVLSVPAPSSGTRLDVQLRPWFPVDLLVRGIPEERGLASLSLAARPTDWQGVYDYRYFAQGHEVLGESGPTRRFRFWLGAGSYRIDGGGALYDVEATVIEVRATEQPQLFVAHARPSTR